MAAQRELHLEAVSAERHERKGDAAELLVPATFEQRLVEAVESDPGAGGIRGGGAERVAREGGDGRCSGPLPGHVSDHDGPLVRAAAEDVIEVTTDSVELAGRPVADRDVDARDLGDPGREQ